MKYKVDSRGWCGINTGWGKSQFLVVCVENDTIINT